MKNLYQRIKGRILHGTLTIGRGKRKYLGGFSWGLELSLWSPELRGICPKLEIYCFRLASYPPRGSMFRKDKDIRGFWKIYWIMKERDAIWGTKIWKRKGYRDKAITYLKRPPGFYLKSW
ncbi:MAG: hypothetical protein WC767_03620 [Candidatus Paceibacterota bacterium]|jgi:hypothetical protein